MQFENVEINILDILFALNDSLTICVLIVRNLEELTLSADVGSNLTDRFGGSRRI